MGSIFSKCMCDCDPRRCSRSSQLYKGDDNLFRDYDPDYTLIEDDGGGIREH